MWNRWDWTATATPKPLRPSWVCLGRGTQSSLNNLSFTWFRGPKRPNKILPHSRAYFVPTATNKDPPCTPLGRQPIKFYPIPTPESFVKNGIAAPKWPGRIFFPTSTPVDPLIRI